MRLSPEQALVVNSVDSVSLVSCPGSGKTRTLVAKLIRELERGGDSTRIVSCITYTNAAVNEIESRLELLLPGGARRCEVETIHSFCLKHIIAPHSWILPQFECGFSVLGTDDPQFVEIVKAVVKRHRLKRYAEKEFESLARGVGTLPEGITRAAAEEYWAELDARGLIDFSGMIYWSVQIARNAPYVASGLASRYRWIIVDEFQDTSSLQVVLLKLISAFGRTNFFIVGDPFQSIMSVAGADPGLMAAFAKDIVARQDVRLLENYRSSANILRLADVLCPRGAPMVPVGVEKNYPHVPEWRLVDDMADAVADVFVPALKRLGIPLSSSAVLANRWTSLLPISRKLRTRNIPAIGPGARPYKKSNHLIAPLVEEVAAYLAERTVRGVAQMRRELKRLIQTVVADDSFRFGFAGDVAVERIVRASRGVASPDVAVGVFLKRFAEIVGAEVVAADFVPETARHVLSDSADAMVRDIVEHEARLSLPATTVRDLGLFAYGSSSLRLLTMHGSKGREYDAVALVDLFDGHVPFYKCLPGDEIEAEGRRLLYVAFTRARKLLMMFSLREPGKHSQPSRFLFDVFPQGGVV